MIFNTALGAIALALLPGMYLEIDPIGLLRLFRSLCHVLTRVLAGATAAPPVGFDTNDIAVDRRALPNAPDGYAPASVGCPANRPTLRSAATLSPNEINWLKSRRSKTLSAMKDFFGNVKVGNFDVTSYLEQHASNSSNLPNIGMAVSGGGYRALMNGAGAIKAFDSRSQNSTTPGHLGGLLQSATYVSGLSGGSWLLGSIFVNNFSSIEQLQTYQPGAVWQLGNSIFEGPNTGGVQILDSTSYYTQLIDAVDAKKNAGFDTTITDYW